MIDVKRWVCEWLLQLCHRYITHHALAEAFFTSEGERLSVQRCGYNISVTILLQAYLYLSLLRGDIFKVLPFRSYTLSPTMLPLLETFLELLLWNSFQCRQIFSVFSVSSNLRSLKVEFISQSHSEHNQGNGWVFHFHNRFLGQKLLEIECLVSFNLFKVENPYVGPKSRPFSTHRFTKPHQHFPYNTLG
jgi:hypothetical protein